jgi:multidrug efflux pump subunit AcrA (membrane-fusion protein)
VVDENGEMSVTRGQWMVAAVAALVLASAGAFFAHRRHSPPPKPAPVPQVAVAPQPVEVTLTGKIQPSKVIKIGAPVDGTIEQFIADVDDDVSAGEVLARITNPKIAAAQQQPHLEIDRARNRVNELEAALISARLEASRLDADTGRVKLELARALKEYERQQTMMREGVTPRLVFEKAEQEYASLKAQSENLVELSKNAVDRVASLTKELETAKQTVEKKSAQAESAEAGFAAGEVTSPADGVVLARRGEARRPVTKAITDLFLIAVDLGSLRVVVAAEPQMAPRIHVGQAVTIEIVEIPSTAPGTVREIKSGQVLIEFTSPALTVRPGMTAQVKIKLT